MLLNLLWVAALVQEPCPEPGPGAHGDAGGRPGSGSVTVQVGFYDRGDGQGQGNPFLDESLTVVEPLVLFSYNVSERTTWFGKLSYDWVSSASIDRLSNYPTQSGASGDFYVGAEVGMRTRVGDRWTVGGRLGASFEYDYQSLHAGAEARWTRPDDQATLVLDLSAYLDSVDLIRFDGREDGSDDRTTLSATAAWSQVLGPRTLGDVGVTVSSQSGFLATPYNAVVLEDPNLDPNPYLFNRARGVEVTEEVPGDRLRAALYGGIKRSLGPGRAIELRGRVYSDDWGIAAFDVEPRFYQALGEKHLLRLRMRYYSQTAADFFARTFLQADGTPPERTQDSDLGDYSSWSVGLKWTYLQSETSRWGLGLDFVDRDDGLDNVFGFVSWTWSF